MWPDELVIWPAMPSELFFVCLWLEKGSEPPLTYYADTSSQTGRAQHHLELHHPIYRLFEIFPVNSTSSMIFSSPSILVWQG